MTTKHKKPFVWQAGYVTNGTVKLSISDVIEIRSITDNTLKQANGMPWQEKAINRQ